MPYHIETEKNRWKETEIEARSAHPLAVGRKTSACSSEILQRNRIREEGGGVVLQRKAFLEKQVLKSLHDAVG